MKFKNIKPSREFNKTYDQNYKSLIAAVLGQAIQDYAFPQRFAPGGHHDKCTVEQARVNRQELDKFFAGEWCEMLCDAIEFPRQVLLDKELIISSGRKVRVRKGGRVDSEVIL